MTAFTDAFAALLGNEGKYVDNPADPGGATMYGITERTARAHGYQGDMRDLPLAMAQQIAKTEYWDSVKGDALDPQLAFQLFDAAYNSGPAQAIKWLQTAAHVTADGNFGPATLVAVDGLPPDYIILRFDATRLLFMADLPTWPTFGRGWARRIANNLLRVTI